MAAIFYMQSKNKIRFYFCGLQLYFKKYGVSGSSVIILHGLFGMSDNWHNVAQNLSQQYTVYGVDLRNHGKSFHSDEMTYECMAQDVLNLIEHEGLEKTILIGHSMGGKTAMMCANLFGDRISKLVVVDIAPKQYNASHQIYFDAMKLLNFKLITRKEIENDLSKTIKNEAERLFILKNLYRTESDQFGLKLNIKALDANYLEILKGLKFNQSISIPTLFIKGAQSDYITLEDQSDIRTCFKNVSFSEVDSAGHWVHAENPIGFMKELRLFFDY